MKGPYLKVEESENIITFSEMDNKKTFVSNDNHIFNRKHHVDFLIELAISNSPLFFSKFYEMFPQFLQNIQLISTDISYHELRYLAFFKLDFTTKEIAIYTKSTVRAIESRRFRLRKKLNVPKEIDFNIWLMSIEN
jgi:hypothetical protein